MENAGDVANPNDQGHLVRTVKKRCPDSGVVGVSLRVSQHSLPIGLGEILAYPSSGAIRPLR